MKRVHFLFLLVALVVVACNAPYDDDLPEYDGEIVVEAYLNQSIPLLNYCLLSRSVAYYNPNLDVEQVSEASIYVYEGVEENGELTWDRDNGQKWEQFPQLLGAYVPAFGWAAKENTFYLMEIEVEGKNLSAITQVPKLVEIDTLFIDNRFNSVADSVEPFERLTFSDPKGFGNNYALFRTRKGFFDNPLTWGSMRRIFTTDDEFFDGNSWGFSSFFPQTYGDTVTFYLASMDKASYRFWESYDVSQNNGGPFSQPINVESNIEGGRGVFCGLAVDRRRIIIEKP
ncbi:MAG: DUF4249 domain-containing protein [Bacteroidetes bacterium]|nr:DUF4249 domain-containing protein [Bacteroidota bacterium]